MSTGNTPPFERRSIFGRCDQRTVKCPRCGRRDFYHWHVDAGWQFVESTYVGWRSACRRRKREGECLSGTVILASKVRTKRAYIHTSKCEDVWVDFQSEGASVAAAVAAVAEPAKPEPKPALPPAKPEPAPKQEPAPTTSDAEARLTDAIRAIAGTAVDEHKVRTIVDESVKDVEARLANKFQITPTVVHVKRDDRPAKPVEGLTHSVLPTAITVVQSDVPLWLHGPAGTGKTTIGRQVADALELAFHPQSFSAHAGQHDVVGFVNAHEYVRTPARDAWENGGVWLLNEVDAASPDVLVAANDLVESRPGSVYVFPDGEAVERHDDFRVIATANTNGSGPDQQYTGRDRLDASTTDRYAILHVPVDEALEQAAAAAAGLPTEDLDRWIGTVRGIRRLVEHERIDHLVTPRAAINGARLLAAGLPFPTVVDTVLRKGLSGQDWDRVKAGVQG